MTGVGITDDIKKAFPVPVSTKTIEDATKVIMYPALEYLYKGILRRR